MCMLGWPLCKKWASNKSKAIMWCGVSFLTSCKVHGGVNGWKWAFEAPCNAAPLVTHIYAKAGIWAGVVEVRTLRKSAGWSWVESAITKFIFSQFGNATHPQTPRFYLELEKLNLEMNQARNMPKHIYNL